MALILYGTSAAGSRIFRKRVAVRIPEKGVPYSEVTIHENSRNRIKRCQMPGP